MIFQSLSNYFSLIKFSHTLFALPFAIIGFLLAVTYTANDFDWNVFALVMLCMIFARNAAMAFNRYIDRNIDIANVRTSFREIPSGIISPRSAMAFVMFNAVLFIATAFFINEICFYLSPVALAVILGYSYTKRFTYLSHLVLGLGLSFAPIGAYLAVAGEFALLPLFFSFTVLFWVSGFDIIYALQDEGFDKLKMLKSIPVKIGNKNALIVSSLLHLLSVTFIVIAGLYAEMSVFYWLGATIFSALLVYQHTLVKPYDFSKVNLAFFTTNGIASVIFAVFVALDLSF